MMTREQMIDAAVREYAEYLSARTSWRAGLWLFGWDTENFVHSEDVSAIRFAYWRIKNEEEFRNR